LCARRKREGDFCPKLRVKRWNRLAFVDGDRFGSLDVCFSVIPAESILCAGMIPAILVVALNPSIDVEWEVDEIRWEEKNSIRSEGRWPGGKGGNVGRWLGELLGPW